MNKGTLVVRLCQLLHVNELRLCLPIQFLLHDVLFLQVSILNDQYASLLQDENHA